MQWQQSENALSLSPSTSLVLIVGLSLAWQTGNFSAECPQAVSMWLSMCTVTPALRLDSCVHVVTYTCVFYMHVLSVYKQTNDKSLYFHSIPFPFHRSCGSNDMWVYMFCQLSSCQLFDWLVFGLRRPEWLSADSGGQKGVARNHLGDLTAFIIDCAWSWSGLPTQADGKQWCAVNSMIYDETLV